MLPIPEEFTYDFWLSGPSSDSTVITVTCVMPNGIIILLNPKYNATLAEVKEDLWDEAQRQPLYGRLQDMSVYLFSFINNMAQSEVATDESRRLCDIRPTGAVFKITEIVQEKPDDKLNVQISHLIGKPLREFDALNNSEITDFRFKMRKLGDTIVMDRAKLTWLEKLCYYFPPRMSPVRTNLLYGNSQVFENVDILLISQLEDSETKFTFNVSHSTLPSKLIEMVLNKKANLLNVRGEKPSDYVLKVCGQDEFLVGDYPLIEFQYIQDSIARDIVPTVVTISVKSVPIEVENHYECLNNLDITKPKSANSTLTLRKKGKYTSSWNIEEYFTIIVSSVTNLNCKNTEIGVQAGIFHGGKSLCQAQKTQEKSIDDYSKCEFDDKLVFDIKVCNIPKCAKLCFVVYEVTKNNKSGKTKKSKDASNKDPLYNSIAWVNTTIYDFRSQLKSGLMTLYMWTPAEDMMIVNDELLYPLGTVVTNPKHNATILSLTFDSYGLEQSVMYPLSETLIKHAKERNKNERNNEQPQLTEEQILGCKKLILESDSFYELYDQDRKNLWSLRQHWLNTCSDILPKLLNCIDWNNKDVISETVYLIQGWHKLSVERALELLDFAYADQEVRSFAVKCLEDVSDEDLLLYLLQLVQALKHELYLDCDLVKFLLHRALQNQKIGHYLFWHLRAEMQVPSVSVRFGLILEAYCRGSREHISMLLKQLECLEKLKKVSELVRERKDKDKAKAELQKNLDVEAVQDIRSPLNPSYRCVKIRSNKCKVMDSKMKPLWIVFENSDFFGDDIYLIFKNGDDLRQDMLTLQMLRIMDRLWKREGLDLRMNPYNCISMEYRVGMIEVVLHAETIANIQKEKGVFTATSAFRKGSLLAWLKDYNTTEVALKKAISEFTLSCAGYCVATYVLGVADRHSDNIMVKKSGQLFHIDFGHILGHFKEKFGFKRERVPFVLTHDFVHVISKGQKNALEFKIFQEICEKAFLILRKHGELILSLFAMMISTGLPELSSEKDLNYLRDTLVLSKSEDDALTHFRSKFNEALSNSWKTSLNWASHNLAKNNKA